MGKKVIHLDFLPSQKGIKKYFHIQRLCFNRIGINPTSLDRTIFNYFLTWIPVMSQIIMCLPNVLYAIKNIEDMDEVTDSLSNFWQGLISIFKLLHFMRNRKKLVILIRKIWLRNLEAKDEELSIIAEENRKDILFSSSYYMAVVTTGIFALLAPLAIASIYTWKGESFWENLHAPIKGYYIIDKLSVACYCLIYIFNTTTVYAVLYISVAIDTLYSWFMCNIVAQFRILKLRIRRAGHENDGNCSKKTICECIEYYGRTIGLADDFNDAFCVVVFIKFTLSCIQICCLAFQFSRGGELMDQMFHGLFLIAVSMQLILYCYGGQRIQNESSSITTEIYDSFLWEHLSISNKKLLLFTMLRSQESCKVSGIFFTADLSLFLWVYRTAFSFITMLWTLEEQQEVLM